MAKQPSALVACGDYESSSAFARALFGLGIDTVLASSVEQARAILLGQTIHVVLCQRTLPDGSFHDLLRASGLVGSRVPLVVWSPLAEMDEYLEAMESGAFDFMAAPFQPAELSSIMAAALRCSRNEKKRPVADSAVSVSAAGSTLVTGTRGR